MAGNHARAQYSKAPTDFWRAFALGVTLNKVGHFQTTNQFEYSDPNEAPNH